MNLKKKILQTFIVLSILGMGIYCVTEVTNEYNNDKDLELDEDTVKNYFERESDEKDEKDYILENENQANPLKVYNESLKGSGNSLTDVDIEYLSSLREDQAIVALNSTIGHYNIVDLDSDDVLVVVEEDSRPRVVERDIMEDYYYDILTGIYASEGMLEVDHNDAMPFLEYIKKYDLEPVGYCLPNIGTYAASDEALKTIEEVYGEIVKEAVRENGLPLPYYGYEDIYNVEDYKLGPVKELNN